LWLLIPASFRDGSGRPTRRKRPKGFLATGQFKGQDLSFLKTLNRDSPVEFSSLHIFKSKNPKFSQLERCVLKNSSPSEKVSND
jgi:hypothetical protein